MRIRRVKFRVHFWLLRDFVTCGEFQQAGNSCHTHCTCPAVREKYERQDAFEVWQPIRTRVDTDVSIVPVAALRVLYERGPGRLGCFRGFFRPCDSWTAAPVCMRNTVMGRLTARPRYG
jgi:hypothetical protein